MPLLPTSESDLLERGDELAVLSSAIDAAEAGVGTFLLVDGPAGVGKTALLLAAQRLARDRGIDVLTAVGDELESAYAWGLVRQLFETRVAALSRPERAQLFDGAAAVATALFGASLEGSVSGAIPDDVSSLLHSLHWLSIGLAGTRPMLLTVDDAHLGDLPSVRWLAYVARRAPEGPLITVVAIRSGERTDASAVIGGMRRDAAIVKLAPAPLTDSAAACLIGRILGQDPDGRFVAACHDVTGGNPFLLSELARALVADGTEPTAAASEQVHHLVPSAVGMAVFARLARLSRAASRLASVLAVLGRDAQLWHAATLAGLAAETAAEAADELTAAAILKVGSLNFLHPLVREAVYVDIPAHQRSIAHARAADLLWTDGAPPHRVAAHLLHAPGGIVPAAVDVLRMAAAEALQGGAPVIAVECLRAALREPLAGERVPLLLELARLEIAIGAPAAEDHLRQVMAQSVDAAVRAEAAKSLAQLVAGTDGLDAALVVLRAALDEVGDAHAELGHSLRFDIARLELHVPDLTVAATERIRDIAVQTGEPLTRSACLAILAQQSVIEHRPIGEIRLAAERALAGGLLFAPSLERGTWHAVVDAFAACGDLERANDLCERARQEAQVRGSVAGFVMASGEQAALAMYGGALDEARMYALDACDADTGNRIFAKIAAGLACWAASESGESAWAEDLLDRGRLAGEVGNQAEDALVLVWRGHLRAAQGRLDAAIADLRRGGHLLVTTNFDSPLLFPWRCTFAATLARRDGVSAEGTELVEHDLELARRTGSPRATGAALRVAGLLQGGEAGLALLEESASMLERSGANLERAHALVELGAALRRRNRRRAATEPLRTGLDLADRCGAAPLVSRARTELAALGLRPRRTARTGPSALTASELRAAQMAANGMTNREIAQTLFVTTKTVEAHLRGAYQKLGVTSRSGLVEALDPSRSP